MNLLYIGEYIPGSTSRFRGEQLCAILKPEYYTAIDTNVPVSQTPRILRSLGWRLKKGPMIRTINQYIREQVTIAKKYDLVWVDKAVFITPETTQYLRRIAGKLVHYTPDNIFYNNRSTYFEASLAVYDYCITTKSFETEQYRKKGVRQILFCTQGFNPAVHHPYYENAEKSGVVFVGLYEPSRGDLLDSVLKAGIPLKLAGKGWDLFLKKHSRSHFLDFKGDIVMGEAYGRLLSSAQIGLGLLSKRFPEQHTTRTLEIPACGTLLATERTPEIESWFGKDEACFFSSTSDLILQLKALLGDPERTRRMSANAYIKVTQNGFDNAAVLRSLLAKMEIL